jgi:hypothetical protein
MDFSRVTNNIQFVQGDDVVFSLVFEDCDLGTPIDISAWVFSCQVRKLQDGSLLKQLTVGSGITLSASVPLGVVDTATLTFDKADTALLAWDGAQYELQAVDNNGYKRTWLGGSLKMQRQINTV